MCLDRELLHLSVKNVGMILCKCLYFLSGYSTYELLVKILSRLYTEKFCLKPQHSIGFIAPPVSMSQFFLLTLFFDSTETLPY